MVARQGESAEIGLALVVAWRLASYLPGWSALEEEKWMSIGRWLEMYMRRNKKIYKKMPDSW